MTAVLATPQTESVATLVPLWYELANVTMAGGA